ncbi:MAG: hypothetical protein OXR67_07375 [Chloroflexota bacterium]|nr:hypothetical protein [Chloroflexota bacterium]
MVTIGLQQETEEINRKLDDKVTRQVAEIMEAAVIDEEQDREIPPVAPAWKFSMPFAGVRYFSYD